MGRRLKRDGMAVKKKAGVVSTKLPHNTKIDVDANAHYQQYLKNITSIIGNDQETFNTEIDALCKYLFKDLFLGVFAHDEMPQSTTGKYCIVNLDNHNQPGSHWVAIADNIIYDSFGRMLDFEGYTMTDDDAEQLVTENNCGQRSIAWLCVYYVLGSRAAMQI